jgi:hypothetical protein
VLDYTENGGDPADDVASLDVLITQCYTWGAARAALAIRLAIRTVRDLAHPKAARRVRHPTLSRVTQGNPARTHGED